MLFYICTLFSGARGSSHALGCGARRGAACTPRHNFGSRNLASNHGVAFRRARATQDHGNPTCQLLCCTAVKASLLCGSHSTTAIAHQVGVDHYYVCVWPLHMRVCSVWAVIRVRESRCVRVLRICVLAPHGSAFLFFFFFCSACCCCCRIKSSVSHRPSGAQALYFVADTVQQQSHSK